MKLINGSRVVIVGGGPAGSFTAIHLLNFATRAHLEIEVTILEPRDFKKPGPQGCNKCAGILSSTLISNLKSLGLELPSELIQAELTNYTLHLDDLLITLQKPNGNRRIASVYRGSGPRLGEPAYPISFDSWLLDQALARGARVERVRAQDILPGERPKVIIAQDRIIEAELVVLASGVNSRLQLDPAWKYEPPRTEVMAQDEAPIPDGLLDDSVHIFFDYPPGLIFGCLIPKGRYANISLLGHKLGPGAVGDFLQCHGLDKLLIPGMSLLCGCRPRVAVSSARNYYADRMVVVGDAAVTRLYKDGIGAAFVTAREAARTAIQRGVSRHNFAAGYHPTCRKIAIDNGYGRLLFRAWNLARGTPPFYNIWKRVILAETEFPPSRQLHSRVLWSMFTGDESYRRIFRLLFSKPYLLGLWKEGFRS